MLSQTGEIKLENESQMRCEAKMLFVITSETLQMRWKFCDMKK